MDDLLEETLAAQTIRKAAQPSEANHFERRFPWEVALTLLPKRLAATTTRERRPCLSRHARSQLLIKKELRRSPERAPHDDDEPAYYGGEPARVARVLAAHGSEAHVGSTRSTGR